VAAAHLEFFNSVADIAMAKAEIFAGLEPGGVAVLNADHAHVDLLVAAARAVGAQVVTYGYGADADWRIGEIIDLDGSSEAKLAHDGEALTLKLAVQGRHMVANAVAALIVGELFGVKRETVLAALADFGAPEGRGATIRLGTPERPLVLIDESYNANSASMAAAMEVFAVQRAPGGRKVLILGDMLELGRESARLHRALKGNVLETGADLVFLVGENMAELASELGEDRVAAHAKTSDEIAETVLNSLAFGDAVMVKGSNGVRLAGLVKEIRDRFS
jgi:UDP-N-acetylmuramoyl-tripeptide--D-alanyl-D-alanine ligase